MEEEGSETFVHFVSGAGRALPSASRWNSIEVDFGLIPASSDPNEFSPLIRYSKSYTFKLSVHDKSHLKRCIFISISLLLVAAAVPLLISFLPHKHAAGVSLSRLPLALDCALLFFDVQKSGVLPKNNPVKFRGDSGLRDGFSELSNTSLVGGFYDSGSNIKFSFTAAYSITLLSWTVIEYSHKYSAIGQLEHVKDIIKWGCDYLLKLLMASNSTSKSKYIFSQACIYLLGVGSANSDAQVDNDVRCWQRPEDMAYKRPVFKCSMTASDLAGEIIAALAAASLVFDQDETYSMQLVKTSEALYQSATKTHIKVTYSEDKECGFEAANLYNSTSYKDEMVWGATWLFFATGNFAYLQYATDNFKDAVEEEVPSDTGVFYWNNKVAAIAVLLTRLRYLHDPGYPYEETLKTCSDMANFIICSYLSMAKNFSKTAYGLILLQPNQNAPIQFAATAAFLSKIYSDYLNLLNIKSESCSTTQSFSLEMLQSFARSQAIIYILIILRYITAIYTLQINYIMGDNPMNMSYLVGFGDNFPKHVHHRAASIPWDGHKYSCSEGERWRDAKGSNPNVLVGAMVAGPDEDEGFLDIRNRPEYTEPSISGNAGLVAALIALIDEPFAKRMNDIDREKIFAKIS
ncbi:endoglucanase 25-like [Canna indica]|uniref:cellulase n=1 Tax=Canna indica TaxID=4628 RepID=A0AAQ3KYZ4_9LILI|nr:endoglucanase 25-like [Canna indica]